MPSTYIDDVELIPLLLEHGWIVFRKEHVNCDQSIYDLIKEEYEEEYGELERYESNSLTALFEKLQYRKDEVELIEKLTDLGAAEINIDDTFESITFWARPGNYYRIDKYLNSFTAELKTA